MHSVPVNIDSMERRKRNTQLVHIVSGFYLLAISANYFIQLEYHHLANVLPFLLVAIASLMYGFYFKKWDASARYNQWVRMGQSITFFILGFLFFSLNRTLAGIAVFIWAFVEFFLMLTERQLFKPSTVAFFSEGIIVPGIIQARHIPWQLIEDVVARIDYLSIFLRNQKYLQLEISDSINPFDLDQINAYCKTQIAAFATTEEPA